MFNERQTELVNSGFIAKLFSGNSGLVKEAADSTASYIVERMYETGLVRRAFKPTIVGSEALTPTVHNKDCPTIIVEFDVKTSATFVPFRGTGDREYFYDRKMEVRFGKIETKRITKNKAELMTIRKPIQQMFEEYNALAMQKQEDIIFLNTVDEIVAANNATLNNHIVLSPATHTLQDAFIEGTKALHRHNLKPMCAFMNANTYEDSLKLKIDVVGNDALGKRWNEGTAAEDSFYGKKVFTTMETSVIPEGVVYFFPEEKYFLKNFLLGSDAVMYFKTEADELTWHSMENPGMGIGNANALVKVELK